MNTQILNIHTASPEETIRMGALIGNALSEPTIIGLVGDLGCGKTVFVKGLARGLAVRKEYPVTSPTYTFINEYPGRLPLFHVDLYRINSMDELTDIGFDDVAAGDGVVVIEWADRLLDTRISFDMKIDINMTGDNTRSYRVFFYRRPSSNLIRELKNNFHTDEG